MSRQDELLALSQQQATQQALKSIQDDAATTTAAYQQAVASGDTQNAAWQLRSLAALVDEYQRIAGPQQQQQQAQQQQGQYTEAEINWLQRHPAYAQDPRKFAEIVMSANALVSRGYDRNSPEYLHALDLSAGDTPDSAESPLTPDEVCKISGIDADTYNKGAADLMTLKSIGLYK